MDMIEQLIREIDVRPRQILIEATILRAGLTEENALGIDFNMVSGVDFEMLASQSPGVTDLITGDVPQAELNNTNSTLRTDFNDNVPEGGLSFGIIKDQVAVFLRALEQVSDTTVLANPKVLALNKQRGQVIVGRRDGYLTTTVTETTAIQTVEFLETGTQLIFRPFIGDDGYVRMEIHPEDSTGQLNESNLPFETTTEVTSNILVRDGHTILIGGLFRESSSAVRSQVPIVGNIPGLGALFRSTNDSTDREEVIILLTVHIVKEDAYAEAGKELAEDVMRLRVGNRRGIQAFGRDRLSLAHFHMALQHLKSGRKDKALWDARLCLHLNPKYMPAFKLKEKLLGRHSCDYRVGTIRDFISRRLMGDTYLEDIGPPPPGREGRIVPDAPGPPFSDEQPDATDEPADGEDAGK
jgi:type IV pilus assembly protein PilQ